MACTAVCPQDAFESEYDLHEIVRVCEGGSNVFISFVRQKQIGPDEIVFPCVGILSKQALSAILLINSKSVVINVSGCAGCCNQVVSNNFLSDYKQVTEFLAEVISTKTILVNTEDLLHDVIVDRRLYLTNIRKFTATVTKKGFGTHRATLSDKKVTTRRIPVKVQMVKRVIERSDVESRKKILELFRQQLSINDNCTACPLCKGICPTGAIQIERYEKGKKLKHNSLDCNGCRLCIEFCKKNALSIC
jgi:NAD-dependent dihydropyrimidine dehydrogenase PreA subunit